jgi:hypothetical protein
VDPNAQRLEGRATITVAALSTQCTSIDLHLRRCGITSVTVNGQPAVHQSADPLGNSELLASVSSEFHRRRVDQVRVEQESLVSRPVPAELQIFIPPTISADIIEALAARDKTDAAAAAAAALTGTASLSPPSSAVEDLPTITVEINYRTCDPTAGAVFHFDPAHVVVSGQYGMARCWMPCIDTLNWCDRCSWDVRVTVPTDQMVISSGDLTETRILLGDDRATCFPNPSDECFTDRKTGQPELASLAFIAGPRKCFTYVVESPAHASEIAFAVGPFIPLADPETPMDVTHFCFEGHAEELVHTTLSIFSQARMFCNEYFNMMLPLSSVKQVFIGASDACSEPFYGAGGLIIYSGALLHDARCIDEGFVARRAIASAVVSCYVGGLIRPRGPEDAWFVAGLSAHVSSLALASVFGKNWYRVHIMKEVAAMAKEPRSVAPVLADVVGDPLFCIGKATPAIRRRAHIIAYIIERRIGSDVLRRALRDIAVETFRAYQCGNIHDEAYLGLRVGPFLKRLRAICGTDVRNLVRSWAASCGTPRMRFGYRYYGRRHQVEFAVEQRGVNGETLENDLQGLSFQGSLCVRVMEPEGTFDHTVEVIDPFFTAELACHSRRTKQKVATPADKDASEEPSRSAPILWARTDPEMEWCLDANFVQTDSAWAAMLHSERDAVAQCQACRALGDYGTSIATKALAQALVDKELYWEVRATAAEALSFSEGGVDVLIDYFCESYTEDRTEGEVKEPMPGAPSKSLALLPNDFSNIAEYMVKRAIVKAVVQARGRDGSKEDYPARVSNFIISLLAENDNSKNAFDDDHYVADILDAAKDLSLRSFGDASDACERILGQIQRYRVVDHLVPSRSGAVGAALIRALTAIEVARLDRSPRKGVVNSNIEQMLLGRLAPDVELLRLMLDLSERSKPFRAREAALSSIVWLYGGDLETVDWLLARVDRASSGDDLLSLPVQRRGNHEAPFIESGCIRRAVLGALCEAKSASGWGDRIPLFAALRRHTKRAMKVCVRILRLAVGDCDERIRILAVRFAMLAWGHGIPVCFLGDAEYNQVAANAKLGRQQVGVSHAPQVISPYSARAVNGALRAKPTKQARSKVSADVAKVKITRPGVPLSNGGGPMQPVTRKADATTAIHTSKTKGTSSPGARQGSGTDWDRIGGGNVEADKNAPRPILGSPFVSKPQTLISVAGTHELTMLEEDARYLGRAWREHQALNEAANRDDATLIRHPSQQDSSATKSDDQITNGDQNDFLGDAIPPLVQENHGTVIPDDPVSGDNAESDTGGAENGEERRLRKEKRRRKKKKKRRRDGSEGAEDDDAHGQRKKKKKKRSRDNDDRYAMSGTLNFPGALGQSLSAPVASSEGSIRSGGDGRLGVIKIKLGGSQLTSSIPPSV